MIPLSVELSHLPFHLPSIPQHRQEEHDNDRSADATTPPPLGVKLTGYRLVFMTTLFSFGAVKSILAYKGQSIAPTTLDWVSGTLLAIV